MPDQRNPTQNTANARRAHENVPDATENNEEYLVQGCGMTKYTTTTKTVEIYCENGIIWNPCETQDNNTSRAQLPGAGQDSGIN